MENAILEQIRSELSSLKERVAALEMQLDEYERFEAEAAEVQAEPEIPVEAVSVEPEPPVETAQQAEEVSEAPTAAEDMPAEMTAEPEPELEPEPEPVAVEPEQPAAEPEQAASEQPEPASSAAEPTDIEPAFPEDTPQILEDPILAGPADDTPIDLGIDLPDFGSGVKSINDVQSRKIHKRLMDSASSTPKWKTDLPGTPVRNIISAISLNDRVLMINKLFREDPQLFQQTIADLNAMSSFADAEDYINGHFSDWKMDSEAVYRFMMAVRRKLNS
jgi:hypothetical protein